ncbi:MAG: carboxymuconolactone decarboxylase family protein [Moraxella sp.]|nr:carboxymuconolactone decarboxylase family protein [Moraxella sp.]
MPRLTMHTIDTAPAESKTRMEAVQKANGFIPNLIGTLANSPQALAFYQEVGKLNGANSLTAEEIEVIQITAAAHNGCDFCVAGHSKIGKLKLKMPTDVLNALRARTTVETNEKYQALAQFTIQLIDKRGQVSDDELAAFKAAGYSDQNVLDVVMGVALATLCNYANNVSKNDINPELQAYAPGATIA